MKAAWYEKQGPAREVLILGEMPDLHPAAREVRIRVAASGINPGDIKRRQDAFGYGRSYPHVIPHSDGAGQVDEAGDGISSEWPRTSFLVDGIQEHPVIFLGSDDFPKDAKMRLKISALLSRLGGQVSRLPSEFRCLRLLVRTSL